MSEPFLAPKGTRDEFFLKLDKRIKKPEYTMHFMVDREGRKAIGEVWRAEMGRHYPAMSLIEVSRLLDPIAKVEIEATAVI